MLIGMCLGQLLLACGIQRCRPAPGRCSLNCGAAAFVPRWVFGRANRL